MFSISVPKKIISVAAVLILIYNSCGYVFVYQQLIHFTKKSIHASIEKKSIHEKIILLSFKKSDIEQGKVDFKWKHKKEFRYKGGMYDIVERIETEDSIHFYCFYDHKENLLEANFSKHFERERDDKKHSSSGRILLAQQITDLFSVIPFLFYLQESKLSYSLFLEKGSSINEPEIPSPPPKIY
jgi:hypothetical protein